MGKTWHGAPAKTALGFLFAAAAVLLASCGGGEKKKTPAGPGQVVTGVVVKEAQVAVVDRRIEAVGTVRARTLAAVAPQVMGRVAQVLVSEGSRVEKGALLAVIDGAEIAARAAAAEAAVAEAQAAKAEAEAALAQAEANRALAEKTFARFARLREEKVVTQQEFEEVEARRTVAARDYERAAERRAQAAARIAQAKRQAEGAQVLLSYTKLTAPFGGIVTEKKADPGTMALPGVPLFTVEDDRRFRVEAAVPETYLGVVRLQAPVEVRVEGLPGKVFFATVSEVVPAVDPVSRTFTAKVDLAASGLRAGMFARVRFLAGKTRVLSVPRRAVRHAGGYDTLFVVGADNVARLTMVTVGETFGDRVEILSGIEPGARVVADAPAGLADGARVEAAR